jgi:hypothetical protein
LFSCVSCFPAWLFPGVPILLVAALPRYGLCGEKPAVGSTILKNPVNPVKNGCFGLKIAKNGANTAKNGPK